MSNPVALITGSAHRVGQAIALEFARKQYNIVLHYGRSEQKARETQELIEDFGVDVLKISADLAQLSEITTMVNKIKEKFGRLDVIVNSAASFVKEPFSDLTPESWAASLDVNLRAPAFIIHQSMELLHHDQADKLIINISDLAGVHPWKDFVQHGVSKAGLIHLTKSLAREFAPHIRVNGIIPGPILPPPGMSSEDPVWLKMIENIPLQRSEGVDPIVRTVSYMIENTFLTGAIINVDGGENLIGPANH